MWFINGRHPRLPFYLTVGITVAFCVLIISHCYKVNRKIVKWTDILKIGSLHINDLLLLNNVTDQQHLAFLYSSTNKMTTKNEKTRQNTYCKPRKNVIFLKVHKCGSSTVQNILFRYGEKHDLNFVMPHTGNYLGNMRHTTFQNKFMIKLPVKEYNILCHHTRFNETNIVNLMPSDSVYVTSLRDPVTMFESIFTYSNYPYVYGIKGANPIKRLSKFLKNPSQFYALEQAKKFIGHGKNPMLYDFGLKNELKNNNSHIDDMIKKISKRFNLVMLTEYFHESLILLKELMCWTLDDIVFFTLNARSNSQLPSSITPTMKRQIRKWNEGDAKLYDHFNESFWRKVQEFGIERMKQEVQSLIERNEHFYKRCISQVRNDDENVWHPQDIMVNTFQLRMEMKDVYQCVAMTKSELLYTAHLREIMKRKYQLVDSTQVH